MHKSPPRGGFCVLIAAQRGSAILKRMMRSALLVLEKCERAAQRTVYTYNRLFGLEEIRNSALLQWSYGAVLFFFFLTFEHWIGSTLTTVETAGRGVAVCWPYFQDCWKLYFLHALPAGYSQSVWYMGLYGATLGAAYAAIRGRWTAAHALMVLLLCWKVFVGFVLSYLIMGPYDYYHVIFAIILLFLPYKEYFLKLSVVLLYVLSATTKLDQTWILGSYFSTLQTGLPLFPQALIPLFTNLVIGMQIAFSWFLLGKNLLLQRAVLLFFITFHLYSGVFVFYHYPSVILPLLLILFGPYYRYARPPVSRKSIASWVFICAVIAFQIPGFVIPLPGDRRMSLEGNRYGMFMFEANHQCVATITTYRTDTHSLGTPQKPLIQNMFSCAGFFCTTQKQEYQQGTTSVYTTRVESSVAWNRCDPYIFWSQYHRQCALNSGIARVALTFDHSINGGPFYRIVDATNVCDLSYAPFSHNDWIAAPPHAPIVGYPVKDIFKN